MVKQTTFRPFISTCIIIFSIRYLDIEKMCEMCSNDLELLGNSCGLLCLGRQRIASLEIHIEQDSGTFFQTLLSMRYI